ncbi:MAG: MBL fold metallo-hydrolase [Sphingobium phenoxybenzoativorans]
MARLLIGTLKGAGTALLFLIIAFCLVLTIAPPFLDVRYYAGPVSGHYDGDRFANPDGAIQPPGGGDRLRSGSPMRWLLGPGARPEWPQSVAIGTDRPPVRVTAPGAMRAVWVGHATMLVQTQGLNILTDPIWSDYATPFPPVGPKRVMKPGIDFAALPRIDLILISHNHYDHLDLPTLKRLWARDRPLIVTGLGNDSLLRANGIAAQARDWGGVVPVRPGVSVHVTRSHHWSTRWGTDRSRALWSSFVVTLPGGNIFFAGDTGAGDMKWPAEAARLGPVRLAIIPIGSFRFTPGEMAIDAHIGPREAVQVFEGLGATTAIPIHWGTFRLSYEGWDTPPRMLDLFRRCAGIPAHAFAPVRAGMAVDVPPYAAPVRGRPEASPAQCRDGSPELNALK